MSALATRNGWRGFEGIGERVPGGYQYDCDGMPTLMGCGELVIVPRKWTSVGTKKSGWLVCYGLEPDAPNAPFDDRSRWHDDIDVVLTFCPRCAAIVGAQDHEAER